jgi:hypothetical protein
MAGAAGEYLGNVGNLDAGTLGAIYLAVLIGGLSLQFISYPPNRKWHLLFHPPITNYLSHFI